MSYISIGSNLSAITFVSQNDLNILFEKMKSTEFF